MLCSLHHQKLCDTFQKTTTALLWYLHIEAFAAELQIVSGFDVAAVNFITKTQPFRTPENLFGETSCSLVLFFFVIVTGHSKKKIRQHQQWNNQCSLLIAILPTLLSILVGWNLQVFYRQEQETENLCPFTTLPTCLRYRNWQKVCSANPTHGVLHNKESRTRHFFAPCVPSVHWRVQHFLYCIFQVIYFLKEFTIDSCMCLSDISLRYFVTVCRMRPIIWFSKELLARSAIASATTLDFGFWSPCLFASTADSKKLLKNFFGMFHRNDQFLFKQVPIAVRTKTEE